MIYRFCKKGEKLAINNRLILLPAVCLALILSTKPCSAQSLQRYEPSRPTTSAYLNLNRFNNSGAPNYYSSVRPVIRQRQINRQTQRLQRQQRVTSTQVNVLQPTQLQTALPAAGQLPIQSSARSIVQVSPFATGQSGAVGNSSVYGDTRQYYPAVTLRAR